MNNNGLYKTGQFSVNRTDVEGNADTKGLRVFRVIVAVLIIGMIVATVTLGIFVFGSGDSGYENNDSVSDSADNDELLMIVGKAKPLDDDYSPKLEKVGGVRVSALCSDSLRRMLSDAESDGVELSLGRGYVSSKTQQKLYNRLFQRYIESGEYTEVRAQAKAERIVPQGGRSESQTGLLVRFKSGDKTPFRMTRAYSWLLQNSVKYGFILRYPADKTDETSMNADYSAFRYVGRENAEVMRSLGKCLDEYVAYINAR